MGVRDDPAAVAWPQSVAARSSVSTLLDGFCETERLAFERLLSGQSRQLSRLLRWAAMQSRYYQRSAWITDILRDCAKRPDAFWEVWRRIPILGKPDLRAHGALIHAAKVPAEEFVSKLGDEHSEPVP